MYVVLSTPAQLDASGTPLQGMGLNGITVPTLAMPCTVAQVEQPIAGVCVRVCVRARVCACVDSGASCFGPVISISCPYALSLSHPSLMLSAGFRL